ncbi:hypothetical protein ACOSQ3_004697 [Xanthoceras sorbifolium]
MSFIIEAELWRVFEGLKLVWDAGCCTVNVESDSLNTVNILTRDIYFDHPLYSLVQSCIDLLQASWDCSISHVFREGNNSLMGLLRLDTSWFLVCSCFLRLLATY